MTPEIMDPFRKKRFLGLFSRAGPERAFQREVISEISAPDTVMPEEEKGRLGLTTLYEPTNTPAAAEIVFIHGLGGGSRKTWSYSTNPSHFWPRAWLPLDTDFQDVRIHSFGYNADWGQLRRSTWNIHAFAQSLVSELKNNPNIRQDQTRIILVAHSMGGCVAKKAYLLMRQDPSCKGLADRLHSIFFLGTPHRGSNFASILKMILVDAWGKKPYVSDLTANSFTMSELNESFRFVASDLRLWSFYETVPLKLLGRKVVEENSATLGYEHEEIAPLNADHRHICKFDNPADPNYKTLRNALHAAIDMIKSPVPRGSRGLKSSPIVGTPETTASRLRSFLGFREDFEDELFTLQSLKEPGSCQWLTRQSCFTSWESGSVPRILWLMGQPGSGKSILSTHIIDHLNASSACCSYFFFKHAKAGKSSLADCLRSLAFQMALQDDSVKQGILQIDDEGVFWDKSDETTFWRKIFIGCIFKRPSLREHFWVIDGVDESDSFRALFSKKILASMHERIHVFATSRNLEEMERYLGSLGSQAMISTLSESDTLEDMRLFLTTKLTELNRLENEEAVASMCEKILQKASGSFLWVRLVLQEIENAWTQEAMETALHEVPAGLHDFYSRMIRSIEADKRRSELAKSILTWVVLARRPLTLNELRCAVRLHLNETIQSIGTAVHSLCEQLVFVDHNNRVQVIHETAREFLVGTDLSSQLAIHKPRGHAHLGSLLLRFISSDVLKSQLAKSMRSRNLTSQKNSTVESLDSALLEYASSFFSDHLCRCSSDGNHLLDQLYNFLKSNNLLSWIEYIAKTCEISDITRTAVNMREYLSLRSKTSATEPSVVHTVNSWTIDLIRVAAQFRSQLLTCPSSIHRLIPPLCPPRSMISKTFSKRKQLSLLQVDGLPDEFWSDCLMRIDFQPGWTTVISHGEKYVAIGLSTGQVYVYEQNSARYLQALIHPERVKLLAFNLNDKHLVSCGRKTVFVWDPKTGVAIHSFQAQSLPLAIEFVDGDELLCALQSSELRKWNLETGEPVTVSWEVVGNEYSETFKEIPDQTPSLATFLSTTDEVLMAVGYRNHPVLIWNALEVQLLGKCSIHCNNGIDDMVFNPNPEITGLVVSYNDGRLCVFDYTTTAVAIMKSDVFANCIACSPNGRILITGSSQGIVEAYKFDIDDAGDIISLTLVYRINTDEDAIRDLAFSLDSLRFFDVRGQQCRAWAPAILMDNTYAPDSTNDSGPLPPRIIGTIDGPEQPEITSPLIQCERGVYVVAGKSDGAVTVFAMTDAREVGVLYRHGSGVSVINIAINESKNLLVSADDSGRVLVAELPSMLLQLYEGSHTRELVPAKVVGDARSEVAVQHLLLNTTADRLLVSGLDTDQLWELPSARNIASRPVHRVTKLSGLGVASSMPAGTRETGVTHVTGRSVLQHPMNPSWVMILTWDSARIYTWSEFSEATPRDGILFHRPMASFTGLDNVQPMFNKSRNSLSALSSKVSFHLGRGFVIEHLHNSTLGASCLHMWPIDMFNAQASPLRPISQPALDNISPAVMEVLGIFGDSILVFLDTNLWICSVELHDEAQPYRRDPKLSPGPGTSTQSLSSHSSSLIVPSVDHDNKGDAFRHFFGLTEWRNSSGRLQCAMVETTPRQNGGRNFVFVDGHRVVVVKRGLEFSESVILCTNENKQYDVDSSGSRRLWKSVSGSMHRRASIL